MKIYSMTVAGAVLATSMFAFAQTAVQSEYFYQAPVDQNTFTPAVDYTSNTTKVKNGKETKATGPVLNLMYERGLDTAFSAGAKIGYKNATSEVGAASTDEKGLTDLSLFFKGNAAFSEGSSLHYGVALDAGLEKQKRDLVKEENNASSGGMALTPFIGYQWAIGSGAAGARLSSEVLKTAKGEQTTALGTADYDLEGGNQTQLTGFYEMKMETAVIDFEARYTTHADQKVKDLANSETNFGSYVGVAVIPTWAVNETTTVLGSLSYDKLLDTKLKTLGVEDEIDNGDIVGVQVGGRFTF